MHNLVWCILLQKPDGSLPSEEIGDRIATVLFYVSNSHLRKKNDYDTS